MDRKESAGFLSWMRPRGLVGWTLTGGFLLAATVSGAYVFSHQIPLPGLLMGPTGGDLAGGPMGGKGRAGRSSGASGPVRRAPASVTARAAEAAADLSSSLGDKVLLALSGVESKATSVSDAIEENERLRLENANLRRWSQALRFECDSRKTEEATRGLAGVSAKNTGADVGRALASIRYTPPAHLLPSQLQILGMTYFEAKEYEKSAVIFTFITEMDGGTEYRTPRNYLLAGASWYRLNNYKMADTYFGRVIGLKPEAENLSYQAQARLWSALTAEKTRDRAKTQYWLRQLVDFHPLSTEAAWINPAAADRVPSALEILGKARKRDRQDGKRKRRSINYE